MILVATEDGVYREDGGLFCCRWLAVYDILEDLVCAHGESRPTNPSGPIHLLA
jgi:hypothetical protein